MDGAHDMGGMHGFGAAVWPGSEDIFYEEWERRVFALHILIGLEGLGAGPGGRPTREEMEPAYYLEAGYYERWLWSAERRLLRKGTVTEDEVETTMQRLRTATSLPERRDSAATRRAVAALRDGDRPLLGPLNGTRFAVGDRVRVRRMRPAGHTRCPRYVRGAAGIVERIQGADELPDLAVYGRPCDPEPVYAVAFSSIDLWGESDEPAFTVVLDMWESYLEAP